VVHSGRGQATNVSLRVVECYRPCGHLGMMLGFGFCGSPGLLMGPSVTNMDQLFYYVLLSVPIQPQYSTPVRNRSYRMNDMILSSSRLDSRAVAIAY
jgi:hypothetical protein